MDKKKIILPITAGIAALGLLGGATFAYFSATVKNVEQTETNLKANKLGLRFEGVDEIVAKNMIPGDSFKKTFSVQNISSHAVAFNIYMEGITNEFNEDLVYTLEDKNGVVVTETALPVTNEGKSYLKLDIPIGLDEKKEYTLTISYKYLEDVSQNGYQGKTFKATLGVDTEGVASKPNTDVSPETGPVPSKVWEAVTGDGSKVGDEIAVGEEHFYVISNDGTTINALAKYNLNVGDNANTSVPLGVQHESVKAYVSSGTRYGQVAFSNTKGWPYSNNNATIDIQANDGPVKNAINAYKELLPEGIEVRLITKAELEGLGCLESSKSCSNAPSWVHSTTYWSGSSFADYDGSVWFVISDGRFNGNYFNDDVDSGVRPVISLES